MNTATTRRLTSATAVFALLAAAFVLQAAPAQAAPAGTPVIVQLPRVVVTGSVQRTSTAAVVQLPRVVVTGKRVDRVPTRLVQAPAEQLAAPLTAKQGA